MADSTRVPGEQVKCHECYNVWPRENGGLQCPRCNSEFVEIMSDSSPPSPALPPRTESLDGMQLTRSRSLDSLEHLRPWSDTPAPAPDPDEDDISSLPFGGGRPQPRGYHWESRSANGSSSFSFSMYSSNGDPVRITTTNRAPGGGHADDPAMTEVQNDFQDLVRTIMGVRLQPPRGTRVMTPGGTPLPAFPGFPGGEVPDQRQAQGPAVSGPIMGVFAAFLQGLGGGGRQQGGGEENPGPFTILQRMLDPANATYGDAVFSQEALDRVITQLMEQNQGSNAPGPASEAAIRSLPKRKVDKDMMDDQGKAECSICMDAVELGDQVTFLPCKHWFHEACITAWLHEHDTCPHCRKGISATPSPPGVGGNPTGGGGEQPSRPQRSSSGVMPGSWLQESLGALQRPVIVGETSPRSQDIRTARQRYYSRQEPEEDHSDRRGTQATRSSRSTPSSPSATRRHRSESHRSNSNGNSSTGGFTGWVRSLGGGGSGSGGGGER